MKIIVALVASLFLIVACNEDKEAQADDVTVEDLAPLPDLTPKLGVTLGRTLNFFRSDTVDGVSYRDTGDIFLEYSRSF